MWSRKTFGSNVSQVRNPIFMGYTDNIRRLRFPHPVIGLLFRESRKDRCRHWKRTRFPEARLVIPSAGETPRTLSFSNKPTTFWSTDFCATLICSPTSIAEHPKSARDKLDRGVARMPYELGEIFKASRPWSALAVASTVT